MAITQLDLEALFVLNPIAKAQMETIIALRESREKDEIIKELQTRLNGTEEKTDGDTKLD